MASHTHGQPALECTIPNCHYPKARFLCGLTVTGWRAGMTRGLCVLPKSHRGSCACADQHGNSFRGGYPEVTGEVITVTLTGKIVSSRTDSDGLKINLVGDGFYIWFAVDGKDVVIEEEHRAHLRAEQSKGETLQAGPSR